jgi:S-adenosylmethionine hydrolase
MRPIVVLLTDFGTRDPYVGALKGAILAAAPGAAIVDLTHEVSAHDVKEAALALESAFRSFPAGAAFLAVVDPGVGSDRRALAVGSDGLFFVGPDNGILTAALEDPAARAHEITNAGLFRHRVAPTFHARDVFGPVAARLASGMPLEEVGAPVADPIRLALPRAQRAGAGDWRGEVLHVDRFGNLVTSLRSLDIGAILAEIGGDPSDVVVTVEDAVLPLVRTYSEVAEGEGCALLGSAERLEVAVNRGSAARVIGAGAGTPVRVRKA